MTRNVKKGEAEKRVDEIGLFLLLRGSEGKLFFFLFAHFAAPFQLPDGEDDHMRLTVDYDGDGDDLKGGKDPWSCFLRAADRIGFVLYVISMLWLLAHYLMNGE